ncbi:hypothetical protein ABZ402_51875 [Streptomyces mirabilis]
MVQTAVGGEVDRHEVVPLFRVLLAELVVLLPAGVAVSEPRARQEV